MKKYWISPIVALAGLGFSQLLHNPSLASDISQLQADFTSPPPTVQTSTYWYWINGNISKEGVIADLESMKAVGINRAFIGNIGLGEHECPYGPVKVLSDQWWEITHAALKKATELDIEIGMFNCPGWSQSGGPWVKPEQAMRYLASSQTIIAGPQNYSGFLPVPVDPFQDVKVIAYPTPEITPLQVKLSNPVGQDTINTSALTDDDLNSTVEITNGSLTLDLHIANSNTSKARSLTITPARRSIRTDARLMAKINNEFITIREFVIDRTNDNLAIGFNPYGPIVISLPDTNTDTYRLEITNASHGSTLAEVELSATPKIERYVEKSLAKLFQGALPGWHDYQWPQQEKTADEQAIIIDPASIIDITSYMNADGQLNWQVPAGNWTIVRYGMTPTGVMNGPAAPEAIGLEVDKINSEHLEAHFDAFIGEILRRIPEQDRRSFKVVVQDSYERGAMNFTDDFLEGFKAAFGYDALPFLLTYNGSVVGSNEQSDRFLWDMRRFVADRVSYEFVGGFRDISHKHGLSIWLENYGHWGFPGEFLQYGGQSDEVGGEFWNEGDLGSIENKAASSSAHIYGKTRVSCESYTCSG
ncbi:MAG: hypothetical protein JW745_03310, partial [Sedimentisphaerales bacterium]|nr:hypothetical protein [Sedimentisphaerales bacterium]